VFDSRLELRTLPLISLVADAGKTFYEPNGVMAIVGGAYTGGVWAPVGQDSYNNIMNRDLERPVSTEWILRRMTTASRQTAACACMAVRTFGPRYIRQDGLWSGTARSVCASTSGASTDPAGSNIR